MSDFSKRLKEALEHKAMRPIELSSCSQQHRRTEWEEG